MSNRNSPGSYIYSDKLRIWTRAEAEKFTYSDGRAHEEHLYSIVTKLKDSALYSPEIAVQMTSWPARYHLSSTRANILRPFHDKLKAAHVLELGSGCGAITRYLGETCSRVVTVEGSVARAIIGAERCRDLDNVNVYVDNIENFETDEKFDVVTLIGVLEYARVYIKAPDPTLHLLELAFSFLKPDGLLVLAIENQLGLKYFCGAPEDHLGHPMYGINDCYDETSIATFGREELQQRVLAAGFARCDLFTPFPDYKLPGLIVYPEGLAASSDEWDLTTLLAGTVHHQPIQRPNFSMRRTWGTLVRNKLVADLANSFLIAAYKNADSQVVQPGLLAAYFRSDRSRANAREIQFFRDSDRKVAVRSRPMGVTSAIEDSGWEISEYLIGHIWLDNLSAIVARPGWKLRQILDWAAPWVAALQDVSVSENLSDRYAGYKAYLPGHYYDATPANFMMSADNVGRFFDFEWEPARTIPLELALLNGLMVSVERMAYWAQAGEDVPQNLQAMVSSLMAGCGYPLDSEQFSSLQQDIVFCRREYLGVGEGLAGDLLQGPKEQADQESLDPDRFYGLWQQGHSYLKRDALWMAEAMDAMVKHPRFHFAVIVPEGGDERVANNIKSMGHQFYPHWHVTFIAMSPPHSDLTTVDFITWIQADADQHLAILNSTLLETKADWVGMLEAGDKLAPHALFACANKLTLHPEYRLLYSDEDSVDETDAHSSPYFKTDFNLEMLRAAPFVVGGVLCIEHGLFVELGGIEPALEGVEAFDLTLRAWERVGSQGIGHIADILYHRYTLGGHCRRTAEEVTEAHRLALASHLDRVGLSANVMEGLLPGTCHIHYEVADNPLVSILIPTRNQLEMLKRCLTSLIDGTGYSNCEIIILDNGSDELDTIQYLDDLRSLNSSRLRIISCPGPFNYSAINNLGAREANGEFLVLLNNDTAVLHEEWLEEMLGIAQQPDVGAVSAKLFFPDGTIQHAGVILGMNASLAYHPFIDQPSDADGYFGRAKLTQEFSAVTAACLLVKRSLYLDVGGLDEDRFQVLYNDVDFCLRLRHRGYRNVFTPYARLLHEGSVSQKKAIADQPTEATESRYNSEQAALYNSWRRDIAFDPAFNRNLSGHAKDFLVEIAPPLTWDHEWRPRPRVLAHPGDRYGCGEYRIIAPMRALNDDGLIMGWQTGNYLSAPELLRMEPDSIIFQRQVAPVQIGFMEDYIRRSKAFKVYEIDDLITNVPVQSVHRKKIVDQKDLHKRFRKAVSLCDRFVVSTDFLAEQYRGYCGEIVVAENYIERQRWGDLKSSRRHGAKARVGWAGGSSHDGDLAIIADVVKATAKEVDWVFFGMCPDSIRPYVAEYHNGVVLEEYPAILASLDLDLAVAPLEDVPFNHGKSHLRLLEYGVLGYPVICTDITPYRGDYPVTRVPNKFKDWVEAIRSHVADRDELARRGDALREYIEAKWMLEDHLDVWVKSWLP